MARQGREVLRGACSAPTPWPARDAALPPACFFSGRSHRPRTTPPPPWMHMSPPPAHVLLPLSLSLSLSPDVFRFGRLASSPRLPPPLLLLLLTAGAWQEEHEPPPPGRSSSVCSTRCAGRKGPLDCTGRMGCCSLLLLHIAPGPVLYYANPAIVCEYLLRMSRWAWMRLTKQVEHL